MAAGRALGLILARGGSKGIPRKNLALLRGLPLIAHTILSARKAASIERLIVTTDDEEIAGVARDFGAEVPFMRPAELAGDLTPDLPVFVHALTWLEEQERYRPELIAHLRPTSPLRTARHIDEAVSILCRHPEADSVRSVNEPSENPFKMWRIESGLLSALLPTLPPGSAPAETPREPWNSPRQALPPVYWQNACIDVIRYRTIMSAGSMSGSRIVPYDMTGQELVDIDTARDLRVAELMLQERD